LGALTIAQSQETCAVFGMPKEAIATGNVDQVLAPDEIADLLIERAGRG
jgi:two-component system chemotaxis response regulator CheB